ncbi:hypothetical protein [Paraburkholderia sp.]|uniref:hypothetical protein n=1 Tax=Paraburkholderia sp. TaxID=1926495 RepID=UPI0025DBBBB0|nr:hypothetical protein [Paraburkholderia sp.]
MKNEKIEEELVRKTALDWPWAVIVSIVGLFLAGVAYSLGDAYYNAYLKAFSVDPGGFPADHPTHFVLAVWGALNATIALEKWMHDKGLVLAEFFVFIVVYLALVYSGLKVLSILNPLRAVTDGRVQNFVKKYPYFRRFINTVVIVILLILGVFLAAIGIPPVISIPSAVGEAAGEVVANNDKHDLNRDCGKSTAKCYRVEKNGVQLGQGYVIAQSADRVALYYKGATTQVSLKDAVVRTIDGFATTAPVASAVAAVSASVASPASGTATVRR